MNDRELLEHFLRMVNSLNKVTTFLFGSEVNGNPIDPTPDSWCGRMSAMAKENQTIIRGLEKRMWFATGGLAMIVLILKLVFK